MSMTLAKAPDREATAADLGYALAACREGKANKIQQKRIYLHMLELQSRVSRVVAAHVACNNLLDEITRN